MQILLSIGDRDLALLGGHVDSHGLLFVGERLSRPTGVLVDLPYAGPQEIRNVEGTARLHGVTRLTGACAWPPRRGRAARVAAVERRGVRLDVGRLDVDELRRAAAVERRGVAQHLDAGPARRRPWTSCARRRRSPGPAAVRLDVGG